MPKEKKYYEPRKGYNSLTGLPVERISSARADKYMYKGIDKHYIPAKKR
jgi:hypothetical protein